MSPNVPLNYHLWKCHYRAGLNLKCRQMSLGTAILSLQTPDGPTFHKIGVEVMTGAADQMHTADRLPFPLTAVQATLGKAR